MDSSFSKWLKYSHEYITAASAYLVFCRKLSAEQAEQAGVCGSWTTRQLTAHITGWEKEVITQYVKISQGLKTSIRYQIDEFNRQSVEARSQQTWEQTIQELAQAQNELQSMVNKVGNDDIVKTKRYLQWIKILAEHYQHHLDQVITFWGDKR
ncbi:MAG TPA: DinB family protein [bacterium]|nr:DinB family protein [bacterium]HPN45262.1 DinB family protein [bacterium]